LEKSGKKQRWEISRKEMLTPFAEERFHSIMVPSMVLYSDRKNISTSTTYL
jgi:hypothetical protein